MSFGDEMMMAPYRTTKKSFNLGKRTQNTRKFLLALTAGAAIFINLVPAISSKALATQLAEQLPRQQAAQPSNTGATVPSTSGPFISANDLARIKVLRDAVRKRNFKTARTIANTMDDPIAASLAQWYYFYAQDPKVDITDAMIFLNAHVDWPMQERIQRHIESRIISTTSTSTILSLFEQRDPLTGAGKIALARAQFATGEREAGIIRIRDAWANDNFTGSDERSVLQNYSTVLRTEDHVARTDRLLWAKQVTNARRVFSYLPSDERRKADTRAALLMRAKNAVALYESLNEADRYDSGVAHAAIRYFRRSGEEMRAIQIANAMPSDPDYVRNGAAHWTERQLLMRWALKNLLYADAYTMAAGHGLEPGSTLFSEAEFNAGWIALRYLNEPKRAETHFAALTASVGTPISLSRGFYWLGRAALAAGDETEAIKRYKEAANYPYSYYGQLAIEELGTRFGEESFTTLSFTPAPPATAEDKARFASRPAAIALRMLTEVNDPRAFLIFSYHLDDQLESTGEFLELADTAARIQSPHVTVRAGKAGVRRGIFAPQVVYPTITVPFEATRFVPAEVILGLSRQESEFNPRAYSRAGARGVMQLIPSTAEITARKEGLSYRRAALLNDANYNMTIGSAHLSHLLADLNGYYPLVFSGYNAGKSRARQWIGTYGDPRAPDIDPIDWVEQIPFAETRNYVQRVMENIQVYKSVLKGAPLAEGLTKALERGGPSGRVAKLPALTSRGPTPALSARIIAIAAPVLDSEVNDTSVASHTTIGMGAAVIGKPDETSIDAHTNESTDKRDGKKAVTASKPTETPTTSLDQQADDQQSRQTQTNDTAGHIEDHLNQVQEPKSSPTLNANTDAEKAKVASNEFDPTNFVGKTEATTATDLAKGSSQENTTGKETAPIKEFRRPLSMAPISSDGDDSDLNVPAANAINSNAAPSRPNSSSVMEQPGFSADALNTGYNEDAVKTLDNDIGVRAGGNGSDDPSQENTADEKCLSYTRYIASTDPEAVEAADLNAGSLAELKTGGPICN